MLPEPAPPAGDGGPHVASFSALFGSLDSCACGHCRSVYSPAAYLVDLLQFLDRRSSKVPAVAPRRRFSVFEQRSVSLPVAYRSARDLLLDRRPDIAWLRLVKLLQVRDALPAGKAALTGLFRMEGDGAPASTLDGMPVVLKLPRQSEPSRRTLAELRHEYEILRELDVPGVVKTHALEPSETGWRSCSRR